MAQQGQGLSKAEREILQRVKQGSGPVPIDPKSSRLWVERNKAGMQKIPNTNGIWLLAYVNKVVRPDPKVVAAQNYGSVSFACIILELYANKQEFDAEQTHIGKSMEVAVKKPPTEGNFKRQPTPARTIMTKPVVGNKKNQAIVRAFPDEKKCAELDHMEKLAFAGELTHKLVVNTDEWFSVDVLNGNSEVLKVGGVFVLKGVHAKWVVDTKRVLYSVGSVGTSPRHSNTMMYHRLVAQRDFGTSRLEQCTTAYDDKDPSSRYSSEMINLLVSHQEEAELRAVRQNCSITTLGTAPSDDDLVYIKSTTTPPEPQMNLTLQVLQWKGKMVDMNNQERIWVSARIYKEMLCSLYGIYDTEVWKSFASNLLSGKFSMILSGVTDVARSNDSNTSMKALPGCLFNFALVVQPKALYADTAAHVASLGVQVSRRFAAKKYIERIQVSDLQMIERGEMTPRADPKFLENLMPLDPLSYASHYGKTAGFTPSVAEILNFTECKVYALTNNKFSAEVLEKLAVLNQDEREALLEGDAEVLDDPDILPSSPLGQAKKAVSYSSGISMKYVLLAVFSQDVLTRLLENGKQTATAPIATPVVQAKSKAELPSKKRPASPLPPPPPPPPAATNSEDEEVPPPQQQEDEHQNGHDDMETNDAQAAEASAEAATNEDGEDEASSAEGGGSDEEVSHKRSKH